MRKFHVSLIAAALLVGSAAGVAGQSDEEPVLGEFTGRLAFSTCDMVKSLGVPCDDVLVLVPFSDPRLNDEVAINGRISDHGGPSVLWFGSWLIGDSRAGWVEVASPRLQYKDGTPTQYTSVLVGTGANEGLTAISEVTVSGAIFDFRGYFVPRPMRQVASDFSGAIVSSQPTDLDW
jgi:hypothetical protein